MFPRLKFYKNNLLFICADGSRVRCRTSVKGSYLKLSIGFKAHMAWTSLYSKKVQNLLRSNKCVY